MPDISKIQLPGSGGVYNIKDAVARAMISGGVSFIIAWDGTSAPDISEIPAGVVVRYNNRNYTGLLSADDESIQSGAFYLVKSTTAIDNNDVYDEYVPVGASGSRTWEKIGDTQVDLTNVVTGVTLTKQTDTVLGENTQFTNDSSEVTFNQTTDRVLGEATNFSVSKPTVTVTPTTTNIKATATGTAVGANGTAAAVTGYPNPTSDTFLKTVTVESNKNLDTTSVPNVTNPGTASSWSFVMGTGDASETLIISGLNSTAPTIGSPISVATGTISTSGQGDPVVTEVSIGTSASALTGLGTPSTATALTGVRVTAQPTIGLETGATADTGVIEVATGINSVTVGDQTVTVGTNDKVTAITSITNTVAAPQDITVSTDDRVSVLTNATSINVITGNQ